MFVNDLIYTAAEWRPGPQGGQTFSQKNIKNPFKKIPESLGLSNYPKKHYGALEKIPESLGGIQIIYPEIQIPIVKTHYENNLFSPDYPNIIYIFN
jgi:hypothetical protein